MVKYIKNKNYFSVKVNNKTYYFSKNKFGEYAEKLAELTFKEKKKIVNLVEYKENFAILKLYSQTYGYHDVYIDIEDVDKIKDYSWYICPKGNGIYIYNNQLGPIHRYIMNVSDKNKIIDHINRNPKDNRKNNLRITCHSGNKRNLPLKSNNTSGIIGVRYDKIRNRWCAEIRDLNRKKITANFGCKKYGYNEAKQLAINFRKQKEKEYGYI